MKIKTFPSFAYEILDENVLESITDQLLIDGIKRFEEASYSLLDEIKNKAKKI